MEQDPLSSARILRLPDNKPIYVFINDKIQDDNVFAVPPGNICSMELFMVNLEKGLYFGSTIEVFVNSDTLPILVELVEMMT